MKKTAHCLDVLSRRSPLQTKRASLRARERRRRLYGHAAIVLVCALMLQGFPSAAQQNRNEKKADHYKNWLERDVVYIISEDERVVFQKLNTPEEKDVFIEQFWFRRDPDAATAVNEFKEEHYRRIAYANERF